MTGLTYTDGTRVVLGDMIGNPGGEGTVYAISRDPLHVAKIYHQVPSEAQRRKLQCQIQLARQRDLDRFTAWPQRIVCRRGQVVGFTMPKVSGRSIHLFYRTVDRKKLYPSASWRSVVGVAMNVAAGFAALHHRSTLMADVNESNILLNADGTVRFIDCDSYQVTSGSETFPCNVGTPAWTPPELQGKSFRGNVRTKDHDRFGLALMIFHLLFLGRHPFAGALPKGVNDPIRLEDAIRQKQFVYSRRHRGATVVPSGAARLDILPQSVADMFETAFLSDRRPDATTWHQALSAIQFTRCSCGSDYSAHLFQCPWCALKATTGVSLFASQRQPPALRKPILPPSPLSLPKIFGGTGKLPTLSIEKIFTADWNR